MHGIFSPYGIAAGVSWLAQLVLFLRWLYRQIRNEELTRAFVQDIAACHLPRIYELLCRLCDQQGIEHRPLPPIRWLDLSGRRQ